MSMEEIEQRRKVAQSLLKAGASGANDLGEGITRLGQAIFGQIAKARADSAERKGTADAIGAATEFLSGLGGGSAAPAAGGGSAPAPVATGAPLDLVSGINATANSLGISPVDLATAISYETAGTFDPTKRGPTTKWGQHRGLIQFGEPQAKQYGVDWNDPVNSQLGPDGAVAKYLTDAGVKPGMGMLDVYSAINAGHVGRYNASDAAAGGAPGTVRDKVEKQMAGHRRKAEMLLAEPNRYTPPPGSGREMMSAAPAYQAQTDQISRNDALMMADMMARRREQGAAGQNVAVGNAAADMLQNPPVPAPRPNGVAPMQAQPGPMPQPTPQRGPSAMDVWQGRALSGRSTGGDMVARNPDGSMSITSGRYGNQITMPAGSENTDNPIRAVAGAMMARGGASPARAQSPMAGRPSMMAGGAPVAPMAAGGAPVAAGGGVGGINPQLIAVMSNPMLPEPYKKVMGALLEQDMRRMDPAYQVGLEKSRLELERMRNPQADPMRDLQIQKSRLELERMQNPQMSPAEQARLDLERQRFALEQQKATQPQQTNDIREYQFYAEQETKAGREPMPFSQYQAAQKGGMSLQVDPATGAVTFQQGANVKPLTEAQSKDTVYATRAEGALELIDRHGDALLSLRENVGGSVPVVGNYMKSKEYQQAEQSGLEFLQAILRKDTGAAITASETESYGRTYLPQPGDSKEVLTQKQASRRRALAALKAGMPPQAILAQERALMESGSPAAAGAGAAPAGGGNTALDKARAAIAAGADPEAVKKRLMDAGIDPAGL